MRIDGTLVVKQVTTNETSTFNGIATFNDASIFKGIVRIDNTLVAKEINVQTNVYADYVFDADYKLYTLAELEKFIHLNKHLPEIPSAAEVIEKGMNIAEMQVKLLQKVEELTLYTIEKDKQLAEQQKMILDLQREIELLKNK